MAEATIDSIKIEISASSDAAAENIKKLSEALKELKTSTSGGVRGLSTIKKQLEGLKTALSGADNSGTKLSKIAKGLKALSEVQKSSGLSSTLNAMAKLPNILTPNMDGADKKLSKIAKGLNALSSVQKASGLNSTLNALGKLPDISSKLAPMDMDKFAQSIKKAAAALSPLATEMEKVSKGFAAFPIRIQKIIQSNSGLTASNKKAADSFNSVGKFSLKSIANLTLFGFGINAVADVLSGFITNINAYVENMNLFSVSMGEYYSEAMEYAELVQSKLGIDISEWTRNQGIFMSMAKGFGLANDQAYNLSKGLTELSYDISSFFNITLDAVGDGAFAKVQSGISGELEPLRRLGYALDEATLQQVAYDHGVNQSIRTMTQAQKAIIRYTAIVEQSARMGVIGDMAKTLESPANALRILHMEFKSLSRAIGSIFIPALVKIIPVVQAVVEVLTEFAQALAKLFGFKMTDWSYSDWEGMGNAIDFGAGAADDMADGMSDAAAAAKKLKDYTLGIDELNIIKPDTGAGASGGSGAAGGAGWEKDWDLDSVWDESVLKNITRQVDELKDKLRGVLTVVGLVGAGLLAMKLSPYIMSGIELLKAGLKEAYGRALLLKSALTGMSLHGIIAQIPVLLGLSTMAMKIAPFAAAIAVIAIRFKDLYDNSETFRKGLARIDNLARSTFYIIRSAVGDVIDKLKEAGLAVLDLLPEGLREKVIGVIESIGNFISSLDLDLGDLLTTLAGITLLFVPGGQIAGAAVLAFEGISIAIRALGDVSNEQWQQMYQTAMSAVRGMVDEVVGYIGNLIRAFATAISGIYNIISGFLSGDWTKVWYGIKQVAAGAFTAILSTGELVFNTINAVAKAVFGVDLKAVIESIPSFFINTFNNIKAGVTVIITTIVNDIKGILGGIITFLKGVFTLDWETAWDGIKQVVDSAVDLIFNIETWKQIGKDALDGLFQGLADIGKKVEDWGATFIKSIKEFLGIHSPSTVFRDEIGVYLGEGIAEGMIQSTPAITAAAQGIADSVQKVFNGISYDPGTNYMALINAAKESGDFEEAARLETIRNAKIDGEGLNWEKTFDFTGVTDQFQQVADQFSVQTDAMNTDYSEFVIQTKTSTESIKTDVLVSIETVDTALKTFITQTTNNFRTMAKQSNAQIQSIISALNAIPRNITTVHTIVTRSVSGGSGSTKGYASGGFPDTGELFLAREAGPELVGQIGKRTAVANNAQIVEGIRYGVADANAEQNALLQEQNELLRAILNKSGVYLDGKQLKKSVDKASRSSGANILIGGVV